MKQLKTGIGPGQNALLFLSFVVLVFLIRSLWTHPIEHGDAIQKYYWAAEILRSGDWSILLKNHHTLRWSEMLPQVGLNLLLGARYELFFVLSLLLFSAYTVLILMGLKKVFNVSQLMLLGAILFVEPWGLVTSNQLLNPPAGILFSFAGVLILTRQFTHTNLAIVCSAIFFFAAYGAHVTYLGFAAGGFLWLVFYQRNWFGAAIFVVTLLLLMVCETLIYNYLSDWQLTLGRLEALAGGGHMRKVTSGVYNPVHSVDLLARWFRLFPPELALSLVFFMAGPWLFWQKKNKGRIPAVIECTYLTGLCFALAITFAVVSLDPVRPMMPLRPMYLVPFLPYASIISVYMWSVVIAELPIENRPVKELFFSLVLAAGLLVGYSVIFKDRFVGMIWKAETEYTAFSEKFQNGELILTGKRKRDYSNIARYKNPVKIVTPRSGISVKTPSPQALCVDRLNKLPLHLNYQACE